MAYRHWCFMVHFGKIKHAPDNWYVNFEDGSSIVGWDAIANHVSNFGWEIRQIVPHLSLPANSFGGSRVVSYLVMCIQPD